MKHFLTGFSLLAFSIFSKAQVSIQVNIPPIVPNSEVTIEIKINKGSVSNFAKYQIDVPAGVYMSEGDNKTGSFSFENNRAKIIWVSIPAEPEFVITMKLNPGSATGIGTINQKFYYLEGGNRKEIEATPISVNFSGGPAISSTNVSPSNSGAPPPENVSAEPVSPPVSSPQPTTEVSTGTGNNTIAELTTNAPPAEEPKPVTQTKESSAESIKKLKEQFDAANAPAETKTAAEPKAPAERKTVATTPESTPAANATGALAYKIQIGAYGENPGMSRFSSLKGVKILKEDNFYKVVVGNFKSKEEAIKSKEELMSKGFKGFIVTYQNGTRVK